MSETLRDTGLVAMDHL